MATRAILVATIALLGCIQDDGSRFNPIDDITSVSEDEEREIGLQFDRAVRDHFTLIDDPVVAGFINDLGQEIVRRVEPQPFVYRFRVIEAPTLNAFAVPGGFIYFHSATVLAAGSIDELAGVMAHEIGHVNRHHYARLMKQTQIPSLLASLAGMAAAVATEEPGLLVAAQGINVALQLKWTRELEDDADRVGAVYMTRAGYDPKGITRFFERIVEEQRRLPSGIPPYLFSHPDVESRIEVVEIRAASLRATTVPDPRLEEEMRDAQARLALMLDTHRTRLPAEGPAPETDRADALFEQARQRTESGDVDGALLLLSRAEALEPRDPRVSYRIGELLAERGRHRAAIEAWRRTVRLDPTRALVFYKMGLSHKAVGDRHSAVYAFEQAANRAGETSALRKRADWQVEILTFSVLREVGFADPSEDEDGGTPLGSPREAFAAGTRRIAWWARLNSRFGSYRDKLVVRWIDPAGSIVAQTEVESYDRPYVGSLLELPAPGFDTPGEWTAEARLDDDLIERRSFRIDPAS